MPPPTRIRKRARKACQSCHVRKVRCDVSIRGSPCMNCSLDGATCIVNARPSKLVRVEPNTRDVDVYSPTPGLPGMPRVPDTDAVEQDWEWMARDRPDSTENHDSFEWIKDILDGHVSGPNKRPSSENLTTPGHPSSCVDNVRIHARNPKHSPDILYFHYPFLVINNIRNIPPHDLNFLELQGCLRVPTRDLLYELVQQYFLHVHPILPLMNEGDFWDVYFHSADDPPTKPISLLVFQAMLFASCNFLSASTVHSLGFPSIRVMRAAYYRHAKLLYDLGSESCPVSTAQASLLLSFACLSASRKPNISWLSIAIENAKIAEAHLYASIPATSIPPEQRNILKRVWWCCIIRDRSTGLLMKRPIQITKLHFDFASHYLCAADLAEEFERSRVYDSATKRGLADVLAQWMQLNITLTDILTLAFPLNEGQAVSHDKTLSNTSQLWECKSALERWYKSAVPRLPLPFPAPNTHSSIRPEPDTDKYHSSLILYTNLMLMYYHTSRVVLSHYEVLHVDMLQRHSHVNAALCQNLSTIVKSRQELEDAAFCLTQCHKELVSRGLDRWLPVSAIGCTALPLILHILDTNLAPRVDRVPANTNIPSGEKQDQLNVLVQVMKTYQSQYDGVDWVTDILRHIVNLAQLDEPSLRTDGTGIHWTDILVFQPSSYLRLTLVLDLSLRKGRLAEDGDFPASLRGLFAAELRPLKGLAEANMTNRIEQARNDYILSPRTLDPSTLLFNDEGPEPKEQYHDTGAQDNTLEGLEEQIYLHLAGGMADKDISFSHDSNIFDA
ncbi:hypothetical protein HAV15_003587 [Penicillium sp. str. |nr:hypothetical protein HAV15_003587 [Penicillium sp. str. \